MSRAALVAGGIRLVTGVQSYWQGCEPVDRQRIYFANHRSNLDFLAIWSSLPAGIRDRTRPVAGRDYWQGGRIRRYLAEQVFHAVLIERRRVTATNNPLVPMRAALDQGASLIIFPEGTRNPGDALLPFKAGLWHLVRDRQDVELIPVYLENMNRILPKGEFLPVPLLCSVSFGTALVFDPEEDRKLFLERARLAVEELQAR